MSIEWADNFSLYGPVNSGAARAQMNDGIYSNQYASIVAVGDGLAPDPDPNATGNCYRLVPTDNAVYGLRKVLSGNQTTAGMGGRYWFSPLPVLATSQPIFHQYRDASNNILVSIHVTPTGAISAWRGNPFVGVLLGTTPGPVVTASAWWHIESKVHFSETVGSVEVRVEGVPKLVLDNINTSTGDVPCAICWARYRFTAVETGINYFVKDLVLFNGNGTENSDFLGSGTVFDLRTDSDVALNWTPSVGSDGWSILDNAPPVDTAYIEAGDPPPAAYVASLTNLPPDITSVRGLITVVRARKVDGGDGNLQVSVISDGDEASGADRPVSAAFTYHFDVFEEDPNTAAPWTPAAVNAVQIKLDRTV